MNKLLKGSIAGAAGIALLMGGAGTFALWNDTAALSGGTVSAGTLTAVPAATGSWSVTHGSSTSATTIADINTFKIVPGDKLTYTQNVAITATGANLTAAVSLAPGSITAATAPVGTPQLAANTALAGFLNTTGAQVSAVIQGTATPLPTAVPQGTTNATVTAVLTFPSGAVGAENASKTGIVNLSGLGLTVTQN
ncbi:alternate-type signal peptide domain-containing protein [Leifsonia sp. YAF41]|uniref:alternate-type signal peptide domain-containing protein n=1 Tax=Leifsonia sp. YAF41 TaxID=3233086 RepID=UPI003F9A33B0